MCRKEGITIGIDLGTSNICAAVLKDCETEVIQSEQGRSTIPNVVTLSGRKRYFAETAKDYLIVEPEHTIYGWNIFKTCLLEIMRLCS